VIPTAGEKRRFRQGRPGSKTTVTRTSTTSRREGEKETVQANLEAVRGVPRRGLPRQGLLRRVFWRSPGRAIVACSGVAGTVEKDLPRYLFWTLLAFLVAIVALGVGAQEAFAQQQGGGGGGDAIEQTLTNVRDYLAALSFSVGGIGFVASLLVKGYASINENAHAYAAMGMKGSLWCIVAGVIVTPILSIAAGLAGGG
jgi:hypothetical protein